MTRPGLSDLNDFLLLCRSSRMVEMRQGCRQTRHIIILIEIRPTFPYGSLATGSIREALLTHPLNLPYTAYAIHFYVFIFLIYVCFLSPGLFCAGNLFFLPYLARRLSTRGSGGRGAPSNSSYTTPTFSFPCNFSLCLTCDQSPSCLLRSP